MKYQKLTDYLTGNTQDKLAMSFGEIESILGFELPKSARIYRPWWSNGGKKSGHSQSSAWSDIGWSTANVNITDEQVTFIRNPLELGPVRRMTVAKKIIEQISNQAYGATIKQLSTTLNRSTVHLQQEITILRNNGSLVELPNKGRAKVYGIPNVTYENETPESEQPQESQKLSPKEFEILAGDVMSNRFGTQLTEKNHSSVPKRFDHVSDDETIVGDAKYYTMVQGKFLPPAKFATIAEHVWLLEKTDAENKFLVFGNDIKVPTEWLKRFGRLTDDVDFFFLTDEGELTHLHKC